MPNKDSISSAIATKFSPIVPSISTAMSMSLSSFASPLA
jgi:hypothetical protein